MLTGRYAHYATDSVDPTVPGKGKSKFSMWVAIDVAALRRDGWTAYRAGRDGVLLICGQSGESIPPGYIKAPADLGRDPFLRQSEHPALVGHGVPLDQVMRLPAKLPDAQMLDVNRRALAGSSLAGAALAAASTDLTTDEGRFASIKRDLTDRGYAPGLVEFTWRSVAARMTFRPHPASVQALIEESTDIEPMLETNDAACKAARQMGRVHDETPNEVVLDAYHKLAGEVILRTWGGCLPQENDCVLARFGHNMLARLPDLEGCPMITAAVRGCGDPDDDQEEVVTTDGRLKFWRPVFGAYHVALVSQLAVECDRWVVGAPLRYLSLMPEGPRITLSRTNRVGRLSVVCSSEEVANELAAQLRRAGCRFSRRR